MCLWHTVRSESSLYRRDGLEEAAIKRRRKSTSLDASRLPVEPAPSPVQASQHSSQPPTPSAMTLVQPALSDWASPTFGLNSAPQKLKGWQENVRPCGGMQQGSTAAMQSVHPARQAASVYGEAFDELRQARRVERAQQTSQQRCQSTAPGSLVRHGAPCSSASLNSCTPRLHDRSGQTPAPSNEPMIVSQHQAWPRTTGAVSDRQASGASASCSGRGPQQGPSHTRQTLSAACAAHGSAMAGPHFHQKPPGAWVNLSISSAAALAQRLETPQWPGVVQPMPTSFDSQHMASRQQQLQQQRHSREGQGSRRDSCGLAAQKDSAVANQRAALAEVHRRASEFRALLPQIPPPTSSYEKCAVFLIALFAVSMICFDMQGLAAGALCPSLLHCTSCAWVIPASLCSSNL